MAETLGMLCDKLTIVKLKEYHCEDSIKKESLKSQTRQLIEEIDEYIADAYVGKIVLSKITFQSNKIYNEKGNEMQNFEGGFGEIFSYLATTNCLLWHEQEKVFEFDKVLPEEKDAVIKKLAVLNLERNQCIDKLNQLLLNKISSK